MQYWFYLEILISRMQKNTQKYFGKIKNKKYEENEVLADPDLSTNVFVTMKHSTVKQPVWKNFTEHLLTKMI